jgi:hypothetical protein
VPFIPTCPIAKVIETCKPLLKPEELEGFHADLRINIAVF